jgi:hypothetical protein
MVEASCVVVFIELDECYAGCFMQQEEHAVELIKRSASEYDGAWQMVTQDQFVKALNAKQKRAFEKARKDLVPLDERYLDLWINKTTSNMWDVLETMKRNALHRQALLAVYK